MKTTCRDSKIISKGLFHERTIYDVGNSLLNAQFNGLGGISRYAVINKFEALDFFHFLFSINGRALNFGEQKTVSMLGRKMTIQVETEQADLEIRQFLPEGKNAVLMRIEVRAKTDVTFRAVGNCGVDYVSYLDQLFLSRFGLGTILKAAGGLLKKHKNPQQYTIRNDLFGDVYLDYSCNHPLEALEDNRFYISQFGAQMKVAAGQCATMDFAISSGTRTDFSATDTAQCIRSMEKLEQGADAYIQSLQPLRKDLDELQQAFYASCLNCALSNYKEKGAFRGFLAGLVYQFPARTYFRDGYWTVLSVLKRRPELVRNEILTLSRGIGKQGKCPSAVKSTFKPFWGDHYDSPSFFVLMLYDYIKHTRDVTVLQVRIGGKTVLEKAEEVLLRLMQETDETGLLVKSGRFNRRDWCDNVFRTGYVTYDEALYARALFCMGELFAGVDAQKQQHYLQAHQRVKQKINDILWSEEKGYFVNYRNETEIEDNLSIDTVLMVLFDLTSQERKRSMLQQMEQILESRNNHEQVAGDFGVFCVYPFYQNIEAAINKSTLPYYYHNGADWPYWSAAYAYAKRMMGMEYEYPLLRWFSYNLERGNYTPVEFFNPLHPDGSLMQAWSAMGAFVLDHIDGKFFAGGLRDK